jgi:hypothetical protein
VGAATVYYSYQGAQAGASASIDAARLAVQGHIDSAIVASKLTANREHYEGFTLVVSAADTAQKQALDYLSGDSTEVVEPSAMRLTDTALSANNLQLSGDVSNAVADAAEQVTNAYNDLTGDIRSALEAKAAARTNDPTVLMEYVARNKENHMGCIAPFVKLYGSELAGTTTDANMNGCKPGTP